MTSFIRTLLAAVWIAGTAIAIAPAASAAVLHMTSPAKLSFTIRGHVRGQAPLIGRYGR